MQSPPDPHDRRPEERMSEAQRVEEQADRRIHELEEEIKRLREALEDIRAYADAELKTTDPAYPALAGFARGRARRALDGAEDGQNA